MRLLQERDESYPYSPVHEWLAGIAVYSGAISAIALVWHFWIVAGVILLITSLLVYVITALFRFFNDPDFAKALSIIVNDITKNTPNEES